MRLSQYFLPLLKETPTEAKIISHQLMLKSGMIRQLVSGIYNWLPFGVKVLKNVENIIRQEMDKMGGQEIIMPLIQPTDLWKKAGRMGGKIDEEMLIMHDRHQNKMIFAPTSEEVVSQLFAQNSQSYRDLPKKLYQIHWKFRDEIRPRFGVMRGREFLMKDAYSFDIDKESSLVSYKDILNIYLKIFSQLGLRAIPVKADTGNIGGNYSHEFHILADTGESLIYYEKDFENYLYSQANDISLKALDTYYACAEEKHDEMIAKSKILEAKRGIEVGHIFYLGTKYSDVLDVNVQNSEGKTVPLHMGCYGIGISRLIAAIIESSHDERGIIWPSSIAPYKFGLINLSTKNQKCIDMCASIYNKADMLYDDTSDSSGAKFAKMDLLGLPHQIIVGNKSIDRQTVEIKCRKTGTIEELSLESLFNKLC